MSKFSGSIGVSLPDHELYLIEAISKRTGRTKSNIVRFIVRRYFESLEDTLILCVPSFERCDLAIYLTGVISSDQEVS